MSFNIVNVVCEGLMCFPARQDTLEALRTTCYDPWALTDPNPKYAETLSHGEYLRRKYELPK